MHMLLKTIGKKISDVIDSLGREYIIQKYDSKATLCVITGKNNKVYSNFGNGAAAEWDASPDVCYPIRKQCGEYVLLQHGIPQPDDDPPIIVLLPTVSLLITLGLSGFIQFINDWSGVSRVGDIVVVKYETMWE